MLYEIPIMRIINQIIQCQNLALKQQRHENTVTYN